MFNFAFQTKKESIMTENEKRSSWIKERQRLLNDKTPHLPYALSRMEVFDFQGIKHLIIEKIPLNASWIFLTGENGFGKTSILRAIAKGLIGDEDFVESLPPKSRIYVNGYHGNQPFAYRAQSKKESNSDFQMAGYGASRFQINSIDSVNGAKGKTSQKTYSLFNNDGLLINIERILIEAERAKVENKEKTVLKTFDILKKILLGVLPQLADIKVEYFENELIPHRYQVRYYEKSDHGKTYEPVKLDDLAAGYRSVLTMVGDIVARLSTHPDNSLDDLQGIVLIDEFDAHLHPKYQYELPYLLSSVFPKIQFIVSTHSPIPILSLPKSIPPVVLTVSRTIEEGITVERKDDEMEIHRLNPSALLTSPIFGFQQLFARGATPQEVIPTDNYEDVDFMKKMKTRIQSLREQGLVK
jgi:predicted ATP-dependent endonuclease of OLD family